ncbi:lipopolysaccharide biosynthesis protein [Flagellimonas sp.]|uniref:lipopolysaccharide biosynthesis protein n=1 Tax=Flagellimonas sp. TaxID=2058762 RepID=UPI003AB10972
MDFKFLKSKFSRNVLTLVSGTAVAQAIPLGLSPVLTRIYSPNDFAVFAIYMSVVAVGTVLVSMKYDLAIILPTEDKEAGNIALLALFIAALTSFILLLLVLFLNVEIAAMLTSEPEQKKEVAKWLYFTPLSVFLMGVFNALSFWLNRNSDYKTMAKSKVVNSGSMTGTQLLIGTTTNTAHGLISGFIFGRALSVFYLMKRVRNGNANFLFHYNKESMSKMANRYKRFPIFTLPGEFVNVISNQLPVFLLGNYFNAGILGNYSLMERVLNAPISLLGRSVLDVFKQKASEDYITQGNCREIFVKTFKTLAALAILPCLVLFLFGPFLFGFIFGNEWSIAGEFAQIMAVLFFFKFIASPLSYMFNIAEKQHIDLIWQIGLFTVTVTSFAVGVSYDNIRLALICFTGSYSLLYIINLYLSYQFAKGK